MTLSSRPKQEYVQQVLSALGITNPSPEIIAKISSFYEDKLWLSTAIRSMKRLLIEEAES